MQELELTCNTAEFSEEIKEPKAKSPIREIEKPEPKPVEELKVEVILPKIEEVVEQKVFPSMLPLSERIRKKPEPTPMPKSHLDIEAAIIESSIEMEAKLINNGEDKSSMLSTALRELLEAQIDEEPMETVVKTENLEKSDKLEEEFSPILEMNQDKPVVEEENLPVTMETSVISSVVVNQDISVDNQDNSTEVIITPIKIASPPREVGLKDPRLKDPRTCGPKDSSKMETPVKRKVRMVGLL